MIAIPDAFAQLTIAREGAAGRTWIAALPGLFDELLDSWSCTPAGAAMHGHVGVIVPVRHAELPPAVLKVSFPHPGNVHEPHAFAAWNGRGAVRLFRRADDRFAMLLERAGSDTLATVTDHERALRIQGDLARRLAVPAPPGVPALADAVPRWERDMTSTAAAFDHPLPPAVYGAALATLRELGPERPATLVHGDLHDANILAAEREPWLVVDPKGHSGDPATDALNVIRSPRYLEVLRGPDLRARVHRLLHVYCDAADIDFDRARRWTQAGAVRESLWGRAHGDPDWLVAATDDLAAVLT
ncbi:aminoglycoside phosphotransferase family protein [Nocardia sp. NPDC005978]|uniref:aminoglycoside phosphotransferase family protein n=1 Tax=Nocardia sp. NPDC005978 TaxID=3156725 RepID=UPI0033B836BB